MKIAFIMIIIKKVYVYNVIKIFSYKTISVYKENLIILIYQVV